MAEDGVVDLAARRRFQNRDLTEEACYRMEAAEQIGAEMIKDPSTECVIKIGDEEFTHSETVAIKISVDAFLEMLRRERLQALMDAGVYPMQDYGPGSFVIEPDPTPFVIYEGMEPETTMSPMEEWREKFERGEL